MEKNGKPSSQGQKLAQEGAGFPDRDQPLLTCPDDLAEAMAVKMAAQKARVCPMLKTLDQ